MADELPDKDYHISPAQLEKLIESAGKEAVFAALPLAGNVTLGNARDLVVKKPQLAELIRRAGANAVDVALIQNGNTPTAYK